MKIEAYGDYNENFVVMSDPDDVMSKKEIKELFCKLYQNPKIEREIIFNVDENDVKSKYPNNELNLDDIFLFRSLSFTTKNDFGFDDMTFHFMHEDDRIFGMAFKNASSPEIFVKLDEELKEEDLSFSAECVYSECKENPDYGCNEDSELFYIAIRP